LLNINRKLLIALLESMPSAIYLKDEQGKYLMINENGAKSVGKTVSDFLGKDDNEVFSPALAERTIKLDKKVMDSGETHSGEEYAEGDQCFYSHKFVLRDEKNGAKVLAGISTDISALKNTELKLFEAQQKAIKANQ
jgi:two-component system, cell cycle sensor histidine kinase and response regulator CckA